jgi:hypothetical protein
MSLTNLLEINDTTEMLKIFMLPGVETKRICGLRINQNIV